ncbi:alcohol dehydrogenase catalytic domain-containing protein [Alkalihalobacillus oceani]|uniref:Alcohol dehydrogenase catalytic domain-containing protein n=1 Tax=Halalkalibacter oceani TaxID=1653776 RepID=A0A9X2DVF8_9BACI|nr:alcohol dehydrogenase catalytic domain-containing protein [Halalkalibacter oceani]MCM3716125.1 alcohol dehydrogenase catalytic domain-containing protein [Halalkalibacter oceani]
MPDMKALYYKGSNQLSFEEVKRPMLDPGEVLVQVAFAGICGSDMGVLAGKHPRAVAPLIMGHEVSGVVVETKDVDTVEINERVVINPLLTCGKCQPCKTGHSHVCRDLKLIGIDRDGGFAEFVKVASGNVIHIPSELSFEMASLIEPLAVTVHAIRKSQYKAGDQVVVIGAGPIGMLTAMAVRLAGAANVMICEVSEQRRQFAKEQGFKVIDGNDQPVEKVMEQTKGNGADIVFEVAGVPATALLSTELVKITGQVVIVSVFKEPSKVDLQALNFRELSMLGVRVYTDKDYEIAMRMLCTYPEFSNVITHKLPLEEAERGFALMREAEAALKVLLYPKKGGGGR